MKVGEGLDTSMIDIAKKPPVVKGQSEEELRKVSKDFESMFMNVVLKQMRDSAPEEESPWGDTGKSKFFQSMLDEEYSNMSTTKTSSNSLSEVIFQNLRRQLKVGETEPVKS